MTAQPYEPIPSEADLDAIDLMWMERLAKPWAPTPDQPLRPVRCTAPVRQGERAGRQCGRTATLGTTVCESHGAKLPVVKEAAAARVEQLRLRLVDSGGMAVNRLVWLAENSTSDAVSLKASTEILDRIGVRGGTEVDVNVSEISDPASVLRERMEQLRRRTIEGEVVSSDAQASLGSAGDDNVQHAEADAPEET